MILLLVYDIIGQKRHYCNKRELQFKNKIHVCTYKYFTGTITTGNKFCNILRSVFFENPHF